MALLREQRSWFVVGEAGSGEDAVALVATLKPDVAVIDVEMPRIGGIEATQPIREASVGTKMVALSMYANAHYQDRMRRAGTAAYVWKSQPIAELIGITGAVLAGEARGTEAGSFPEPGQ